MLPEVGYIVLSGVLSGCRTIIWDSIDLEVVAELPRSGNWNFAVQWSPRIPGVFATASFDCKVSMYNLQTCELPDSAAAGRGDFASLLSTASTRGVMPRPSMPESAIQ
jgi:hypothetical protein